MTKIYNSLTPLEKDALYRKLWAEYVKEDMEAYLEDHSEYAYKTEEERNSLIKTVVNAYVYEGKYDCDLSYWQNFRVLIRDFG